MLGSHLLGIYEKAFPSTDPLPTILSKAKALGFDFVELSIDESDERLSRLEWGREQIESLRRACFSTGIQFQSMCLSAHRRFPFGSADSAVRARARDILCKAIDFALLMGIRVIQLAGYDAYYEPSTPESVRHFREGMVWAVRQAGQKQVMLAMEIMDTAFMNSISKHMAYEAMLKSPWYKVYPDLGNLSAWPENDVEFELERGIGSIAAVHLKDTLAVTDTFPGKFKCIPFGSGCVDFSGRFRQLERLGYTGPYMVEMWYAPGTDDLEEITKSKNWLQQQYDAAVL